MDVSEQGDVELVECRSCNRRFRADVLKKHEPICLKNTKKKRKVFDSGKQRAEGSDVPLNKTLKPGEIPKIDAKAAAAQSKTKNWRQRHEALVESLRAARNFSQAKASGGPLPPPPPPVIDPSLVQCPYCQRRFNEEASKRHISFCKEQQSRLQPRSTNQQAKKPAFKAPLPKGKQPPVEKAIPTVTNGASRTRASPQNSQLSASSKGRPVQTTQSIPRSTLSSTPSGKPKSSIPQTTVPQNIQQNSNVPKPKSTVVTVNSSLPRATVATRRPSGPTATVTKSFGFCHECGTPFTVHSARFCSECGARKVAV